MPVAGAGYLTALDALCDISYQLFEPIVDTAITAAPGGGPGTVPLTLVSIQNLYEGALVVVGYGLSTAEIAPILTIAGNIITVTLVSHHAVGERVFAPTFPVQQPLDPLWTQGEMLAYLSSACNDFLTAVPLVYAINAAVSVPPTQQNALLPDDCQVPERVAFQMPAGPYPIRETSQSNLDGYDYRWQVAPPSTPIAYFRDKVPLQNFGIWPRVNNTAMFEVVYAQRQVAKMQLLDGFLFPDIFVPVVKYRALSFAYSKDGEARNPALAKYFASRYDFGAKVARMWLSALNDPNLEESQ